MSHYMTQDERQKLEALHRARVPVAKIAAQLGFCRQTIYRELRVGSYEHERNGFMQTRYSPEKAQQIHRKRQQDKGPGLKIGNDLEYANYLESLMLGRQTSGKIDKRKRYSPAAALAAARNERRFRTSICAATLYSYIDKGVFLHLTNKNLWEKGKKEKRDYEPIQRIAHPKLPNIADRPAWIGSREEPGHFEMDLVVSCEKGNGAVLTMAERCGRTVFIRKLTDKKAATIREALADIQKRYPGIKSITTDNGAEFLEYDKLLEVVQCPVYYCHSYSAWEKGTIENQNRMIRRWFPKGTDFSKVSESKISECQNWLNNYPRKILGWMTPKEFADVIA